jgi:hypothetical protein
LKLRKKGKTIKKILCKIHSEYKGRKNYESSKIRNRKIKEKLLSLAVLNIKLKKIRTYAYLDWSSWFLSKEGRK